MKYIGPKCKLCRREGVDLNLKTTKAFKKCNLQAAPGAIGGKRYSPRGYALNLREHQKLKRCYNITEKAMRKYFALYFKGDTHTPNNLSGVLEMRLDNIVYRLGFAHTRAHARQIVAHKLVLVNDRTCNISSRMLQVNDIITLKPSALNQDAIKLARSKREGLVPKWLLLDKTVSKGQVVALPSLEDVEIPYDEKTIIEFYAKK